MQDEADVEGEESYYDEEEDGDADDPDSADENAD